jgi:hypothetical protein
MTMVDTSHRKNAALTKTTQATLRVRDAEHDLAVAVARAAHWGATWAEIAAALGVSPQAAHKRFRHLRYDPTTRRAWHEPPLPM